MKYNENQKAKILIVDDHPIVREGMAMLINREKDLQACCEAECADKALQANTNCRHDLAIVDMSLASLSGLKLISRMRQKWPEMPILMISMHDETIYAESALLAGAQGYLMKQAATDTILHAIRQLLQGELYVSDKMRTRILQKNLKGDNESNNLIGNLSPNELEVLHLIGKGFGTGEIANNLACSVKTIESYRARIKKKLNLDTGNRLTHFAVTFVSPPYNQILIPTKNTIAKSHTT